MCASVTEPLRAQVMDLLGPSLWDEWNSQGAGAMPVEFVACVAVEALRILQGLHEKGCAPVSLLDHRIHAACTSCIGHSRTPSDTSCASVPVLAAAG